MVNQIIEHIKTQQYEQIEILQKVYKINFQELQMIIMEFNQKSFYYEITIADAFVYWHELNDEMFPSTRDNRYWVLKQIWLCNVYSIEQLELLFARSRKTLYKDIQQIKLEIKTDWLTSDKNLIYFYQNIINNLDQKILKKISHKTIELSTIIRNVCNNLNLIIGVENITEQIIAIRFGPQKDYQNEARILTLDLMNNIERYQKKKICDEQVFDRLYQHIGRSYWRYKLMVFTKEVDVEKLMNRYADNYYQISIVIKMILNSHKLYYNEEEIMYIALYFLNPEIYQLIKVEINVKRLSQKTLIINELANYFKEYKIVEENGDFIISLSSSLPAKNEVGVKIPFDIYDLRNLSRILILKRNINNNRTLFVKLQPLLKKSVSYEQFKKLLEVDNSTDPIQLSNFLTKEFVILNNEKMSWEQAIHISAKVLEIKMYINQQYTNNIIKLVKKYNSEIVITNGIALAHAPITDAVYQSGFSFLVNQSGIDFPGQKQVYLIILFCANNEVDVLLALQELNEMLLNNNLIPKIKQVVSQQQLINLLINSRKKIEK